MRCMNEIENKTKVSKKYFHVSNEVGPAFLFSFLLEFDQTNVDLVHE